MNINLRGNHKDHGNVVKRQGKLSLDDADRVDISRIFHCDGLVLCITKDINSRLVVWNPYSGRTRWIQPRNSYKKWDIYAFGYETKNNSVRNHKILRSEDDSNESVTHCICEFEIYNLDSNTWKVVDLSPAWVLWDIKFDRHGVSLKGNTYWLARENLPRGEVEDGEMGDFLMCFDFTRERFGPGILLPFQTCDEDNLTLSSVGEEQLAVLRTETVLVEIWVTTKIEPEVVWWKKLFLSEDTNPLNCLRYDFTHSETAFFIDQGNKVVVVFDKNVLISNHNIAYIIGEYGYIEQVDLGVRESSRKHHHCPDLDESVSELVEHFFKVNHPDYYLTYQAVYNANKIQIIFCLELTVMYQPPLPLAPLSRIHKHVKLQNSILCSAFALILCFSCVCVKESITWPKIPSFADFSTRVKHSGS